MAKRIGESGNIFFTLFGAVALVGVIGVATSNLMRGPVGTVMKLNQIAKAESQLQIARKMTALEAAQQPTTDCDGDGFLEPIPADASAGACATVSTDLGGAGAGCIPSSVGVSQNDPWGTRVGYCAWDHGPVINGVGCSAGMFGGTNSSSETVIAVISAGPDRTFDSSCADDPGYVSESGDDIVLTWTYDDAIQGAGGLWALKSGDPDTAQTVDGRNIEVGGTADFQSGASFASNVSMGMGSLLDLTAGSLLNLPDQNELATCNLANNEAMRINNSLGMVLQICDFNGAGDWIDIGGTGSASAVYGNDGDVQFNSGDTLFATDNFNYDFDNNRLRIGGSAAADDTLEVTGTADISGSLEADRLRAVTGGTAGNVGLAFNSAGTLGVYGSGSTVGLSVSGSTRFDVDNTGADVTGTFGVTDDTTLSGALQVTGETTLSGATAINNTLDVTGDIFHSGVNPVTVNDDLVVNNSLQVGTSFAADSFELDTIGSGEGLYMDGAGGLELRTTGAQRLKIDSAGDVGVSLVGAPTTGLDVGSVLRLRNMGESAGTACGVISGAITYTSGDELLVCSDVTGNWEVIGTSGGGGGGGGGIWERTSGTIRIKPSNFSNTDDFVVGSLQLDDETSGNEDERMFFENSTGAFRAGVANSTEWDTRGNYSVAMGLNTQATADGTFAVGNNAQARATDALAMGRDVTVAAGALQSMGIGLGIAAGADPQVSGTESLGIFMQDQSGVDFAATNTMGLFGGNLLIDPNEPATELTTSGSLTVDVEGDVGAIQFCSEEGTFCFTAEDVATGSTGAPGDDREIVFNSADSLATDTNFVFTSAGRLGIGTVTPGDTLDVVGTVNASGAATLGSSLDVTGQSYFGNDVGVGVVVPQTLLDVDGTIKMSYGGESCDVSRQGAIHYDSVGEDFYVCQDGASWQRIITAGSGGAGIPSGGSDREIQFNSGDNLEGNPNFVFTSAGRMGIGTGAPSQTFDVSGTANVSGATTLGSTLDTTGQVNFSSGLNVTSATVLSDTLDVTGATTLGSSLDATGQVNFSSGLNVTLATNLSDTLGVTGAATFGSTLGVTGATTLDGLFTTTADSDLGGLVTFTSSGAVMLPTGTTGEQPTVPSNGMIRYNTDNDKFEAFQGGTWEDIITSAIGGGAADPDRGIQFKSGDGFAAVSDFVYTSAGDLIVGSSQIDDTTTGDEDSRMYFDVSNSAFRAGSVDGNQWDYASSGQYSTALGYNTTASGNSSTAMGSGATASGGFSVAFGFNTVASNTGSVAMGIGPVASGLYSTAIGHYTNASGNNSTAIGDGADAGGSTSVAMGGDTAATGSRSTALGTDVIAGDGQFTGGDETQGSLNPGVGEGAMAIGLITSANTPATRPMVTGDESLGIFMGEQNAVALSSANTMGLFGGKMVIDPAVPATNLSADTALEVEGTIKMAYGAESCDAAREGAIHFNSGDNNFYVCQSAGAWQRVITAGSGGGGLPAAGSDTQIQYNSGNELWAATNFVYTSAGDFIVGSYQLDDTGTGSEDYRMFFDVSKGAFRAGRVTGPDWDDANVGTHSMATGWNTIANDYSVATGYDTTASGLRSVAMGSQTVASGARSFAVGEVSTASGSHSVAMGDTTTAGGYASIALGAGNYANGDYSVALGSNVVVDATGDNSMGVGLSSTIHFSSATMPTITGAESYGIFMGDQSGTDLSSANTMGLFGGQMVIDPAVPATNLSADTALEVEGTIKMAYGNESCDAAREGAIHFDSGDNNFYVCQDGANWQRIITAGSGGGGLPAAGSDTQIQYNSGNELWAATNFVYTSAGDFIVGSYQLDDTGTGAEDSRMFFDVSRGAFRAGRVTGTDWNAANIGSDSIAMGLDTEASGTRSTAMGGYTAASGANSTAMGYVTTASGDNSTAMGRSTTASGNHSTAMGHSTTASSFYSTAMGYETTASGGTSTATGGYTTASGGTSTAMGRYVVAGSGTVDSTIGAGFGNNTFAIGLLSDTQATDPMITGDRSMGIFMGHTNEQSGVDFTATDTLGLFGGTMVIDPRKPATQMSARGVLDLGAATDALVLPAGLNTDRPAGVPGMIRYNSTSNEFEGYTGGIWTPFSTGTLAAAAPDRGIQFNSGGVFFASAGLQYMADGDFLLSGTHTGTASVPASGAGTRMFLDTQTSAFRVGHVTGAEWDNANIGEYSIALGRNTTASGQFSTALGSTTTASGQSSTALGSNTTASDTFSTAMGSGTTASAWYSTAMGWDTTASGQAGTAMGRITTADGTASTATGWGTTASGISSTAMGQNIEAQGDYTFGIQLNADAVGTHVISQTNTMAIMGGNVGIGTVAPATILDLGGATDALVLPAGLDGDRPGGVPGMIRYNSTSNEFEGYTGGIWTPFTTGTISAAAPDRGVQFNSGGSFTAESNFVYDSAGRLGVGTAAPRSALDISYAGGTGATDVASLIVQNTTNQGSSEIFLREVDNVGDAEGFKMRYYSSADGVMNELRFMGVDGTTDPDGDNYMVIRRDGGRVEIGSGAANENAQFALLEKRNLDDASRDGVLFEYDGANNIFHLKTGFGGVDSFTERLTVMRDTLGIGMGTIAPDASAVLHLAAQDKGFLPPVMSNPGVAIASPAEGLIAYSSGSNVLQYYNGSSWIDLVDASGSAAAPDRGVQFNSGGSFTAESNFTYTSAGNLGIGTGTPLTHLDVDGTIKMAYGGEACDAAREGAIHYDSGTDEFKICATSGSWDTVTTGDGGLWIDNTTHISYTSAHILKAGETMTSAGFDSADMDGLVFHTDKWALRFGRNDFSAWNEANIGNSSFAGGEYAIASGAVSFAFGRYLDVTGDGSVGFARSNDTIVSGAESFAFGSNLNINGIGNYAWGEDLDVAGGTVDTMSFSLGGGATTEPLITANADRTFNVLLGTQNAVALDTPDQISFLGGNMVIDPADPATNLVADTALEVEGTIKMAYGGEACDAAREGAIRFNSGTNTFSFCADLNNDWESITLGSGTLAALGDTNVNAPSTGEVLYYSTSEWVNANLAINDLSDAATSYSSGSMYLGASSGTSAIGVDNTALGYIAGRDLTTGNSNTLIGDTAGLQISTGDKHTMIGRNTGFSLTTETMNTFVGTAAGLRVIGDQNVVMGAEAGAGVSGKSYSYGVVIGTQAAKDSVAESSVVIGASAMMNSTVDNVIAIGRGAASSSSGNDNIFIGRNSGDNATGGNNILIGHNTNMPTAGTTNYLNIGDIIYGSGGTVGDIRVAGKGAFKVPAGLDADRPSGEAGMIRYNSTSDKFEGYQAGSWQDIITAGASASAPDRGIQFNSGGQFYASAGLQYTADGDFVVTGTYTATPSASESGIGSRMFYDVQSGAFRAGAIRGFGSLGGAEWDTPNIGDYSVAMGWDTLASGTNSVALGGRTVASGGTSIAMGSVSQATGDGSIAMGNRAVASGYDAIAMSERAVAAGERAIALGTEPHATGDWSLALGSYATAGDGQFTGGDSAQGSLNPGVGTGAMAIGLVAEGTFPSPRPMVTGNQSLGIFMGDQSGVDFSSANTMGLLGGNMVIDPSVPATQLTARGVLDLGAATDALVLPSGLDGQRPSGVPGMIRYNSTSNEFEGYTGGIWTPFSTGTVAAASPDRGIQFNSGGSFTAEANFTYTSAGRLGIGVASPLSTLHITDPVNAANTQLRLSVTDHSIPLIFDSIPANRSASTQWINGNGLKIGELKLNVGSSSSPTKMSLTAQNSLTNISEFVLTSMETDTGNDVAGSFSYVVDKATSGNDTGLLIAKTDTNSPGISRLIEGQTDGDSKFWIDDTGLMFVSGSLGLGRTAPDTRLDVDGTIKMAYGGEACDGAREGAMRYDSGSQQFDLCDGVSGWQSIATSAGGSKWIDGLGTDDIIYTSGAAPKVGIGLTTPAVTLDVDGLFKLADSGETCGASLAGSMRYKDGSLWYCNGISWNTLADGSGFEGSTTATVVAQGAETANVTSFALDPTALGASIGDLMIVSVVWEDDSTVTPPAGWSTVYDGSNPTDGVTGRLTVHSQIFSGSVPGSQSWSYAGGNGVAYGWSILSGASGIVGVFTNQYPTSGIGTANFSISTGPEGAVVYALVDSFSQPNEGATFDTGVVSETNDATPVNGRAALTGFATTSGTVSYTTTSIDRDSFTNVWVELGDPAAIPDVAAAGIHGAIQLNSGGSLGAADLVYTDSERLGVGTTSPSAPFHFKTSENPTRLLLEGTGGGNTIEIAMQAGGGSPGFRLGRLAGNDFQIASADKIELMAPVGINGGYTDPANALDVSGAASIGTNYYATAAPTDGLIVEGNAGIGTITPQTKLDVAGTMRAIDDAAGCTPTVRGALRFNSGGGALELCDGVAWAGLGSGGSTNPSAPDRGVQFNSGGSFTAEDNFTYTADGDFIVGSNQIEDTTTGTEDSRMFFDVSNSAFRAGFADGNQWNYASSGQYSTALGYNTTASGIYSTAMGSGTTASGAWSTAMGLGTTASSDYSTAMGVGTEASGVGSTAMGSYTTASASSSTAMGINTTAFGARSTAMGQNTTASGNRSTAIGSEVMAGSGTYSFLLGEGHGSYAIAIGLLSDSQTTTPMITGDRSMGIFMGHTDDQSGVDFTATDTLGLFGGTMVIDPRKPAQQMSARGVLDLGAATDALVLPAGLNADRPAGVPGMIRYNSTSNEFEGYSGGTWTAFSTASISAASPDRGIQFNSGGSFAADSNLVYNSSGYFGLGRTTPESLLDVGEDTGIRMRMTADSTNYLTDSYGLGMDPTGTAQGRRFLMTTEEGTYRYAMGFGDAGTGDSFFGLSYSENTGANWYPTMTVGHAGEIHLHNTTSSGEELHIGAINGSSDTAISMENSGNIFELHVRNDNVFRITSADESANWFTLDGATGNVGIGTGSPRTILDLGAATDALVLPAGLDADRPAGVPGMIRYNSTGNEFEGYSGGTWTAFSTASISAASPDRGIQFNSGGSFAAESNFTYTADGDFIVGSNQIEDTTTGTEDSRMFFDVSNSAFRAGSVEGNEWDYASAGQYSVAFGRNAVASGSYSTAMGRDVTASGGGSTAMGWNSTASSGASTAMGWNATASGVYSTAMGQNTTASGSRGTAMGASTTASGMYGTAMGFGIEAQGDYTLGIQLNGDAAGTHVITQNNTMAIMGGNVGIGTVAPATILDLGGAKDALVLPAGLDGDRPAGVAGMIRYNSTSNEFEGYSGGTWTAFSTASISAASPDRGVQFNSGGSFAAEANFTYTSAGDFIVGSYQLDDTTTGNEDTRMFFDVTNGAFRAGHVPDGQWDAANVGLRSVAMGSSTTASGNFSMAIGGAGTTASGTGSVGLGTNNMASGDRSTAMGRYTTASGSYSTAMGREVIAGSGTQNNTIGAGYGNSTFAIGLLSNTQTTDPMITGDRSMGIFMGHTDAQSGVDLTASDTLGLFGGTMVIDPRKPAQQMSARGVLDLGAATDALVLPAGLDADRPAGVPGMIRYNSTGNEFEGYSGGTWTAFSTASISAASPDRGVQFNSGSSFAADSNFTYTADGDLIVGSSQIEDTTTGTEDSRMFFDVSNSAFRAGMTTGAEWNYASSGQYSAAFGRVTTASGPGSVAMGGGTEATGDYSTALGFYTTASGWGSMATGRGTDAIGDYSTAMGENTTASGSHSMAMGRNTTASGGYSTAMGSHTTASGSMSTAMGYYTTASNYASTATGYNTTASGDSSTAMGRNIEAQGEYTFGIQLNNDAEGTHVITQTNTMAIMGGDVGIGTVAPTAELHVVGDVVYTGTLTDISDMRLKTDIEPLSGSSLEKLSALQAYSFRMKDDESGEVELGVMAQDVKKTFPELVKTAEDEMGTMSVNYVGFIAPLIEASKELKAENDVLRAELDDMKLAQAQFEDNIMKEVKGLKAHTGYGIDKAQMGLWAIALLFGLSSLFFMVGVIIRQRQSR